MNKEKILKVLVSFEKEEQLILQLYFFEKCSLENVSDLLNISIDEVKRVYQKFLNELGKVGLGNNPRINFTC